MCHLIYLHQWLKVLVVSRLFAGEATAGSPAGASGDETGDDAKAGGNV